MVSSVIQGSPVFEPVTSSIPPSSREALDSALQALSAGKSAWVKTSIAQRIALLQETQARLVQGAPRWVDAINQARAVQGSQHFGGDAWMEMTVIIRLLRLLQASLADIQQHGRPQLPKPPFTRANGQVAAQVYPQSIYDRLLFRGFHAEVWLEPGVTVQQALDTQAENYRHKAHDGRVTLVLGAGNLPFLSITDFMHKLYQEDSVIVLKMNPVVAYSGPFIEEIFKPFVDGGFLRVVYGGIDEGVYLTQHPLVDALHMTGSDKTFEAIVFGAGEAGAHNKANRTPLLNKPFTAELGNITPTIVVPGPWSDKELDAQALSIVGSLVFNAGFNCVTPRVVIQHKNWVYRNTLNRKIGEILKGIPTRKAYYPGAKNRLDRFVQAHPDAWQIGDASDDKASWTYIPDLDPNHADDIAFQTEAFCSLFGETALEADSVAAYIDQAVEFANARLWGTLGATLIIHPQSLRDPAVKAAFDRALVNLRYGVIGVNVWCGFVLLVTSPSWGGFSGQDIYDIQSGIGVVNNTAMFARPQKSILWAPFHIVPNPLSATSPVLTTFAEKLFYFNTAPSFARLPGVFATALRGMFQR